MPLAFIRSGAIVSLPSLRPDPRFCATKELAQRSRRKGRGVRSRMPAGRSGARSGRTLARVAFAVRGIKGAHGRRRLEPRRVARDPRGGGGLALKASLSSRGAHLLGGAASRGCCHSSPLRPNSPAKPPALPERIEAVLRLRE